MEIYGLKKIGILEIDLDHSNIDKFLTTAMEVGFEEKSFDKLCNAIIDHFEHEENICKRLKLNMTDEHLEEHRRLTQVLKNLSYSDKSEEEYLLFFKCLLINHVNEYDSLIIK